MKKANEETLDNMYQKLSGDILEDMKKDYDKIQEDTEKAEDDAKKAIEDEKEAKAKYWEDRIKSLQDELDALNNTEADEREKLKKLREERALWLRDNSTESVKKIQDLDQQIAETEKSIKKSELQGQIDDLNKQKQSDMDSYDDKLKSQEDYYKKKKDEEKKANDDSILEEKAYAKAKELITSNNQTAILKILSDHSKNYKDVGSLLGKNFNEAFQEEMNKAKTALDYLKQEIADTKAQAGISSSSGSGSGSSSSSDSSDSGYDYHENDHVWMNDASSDELYSDASHNSTKGTGWDNGIASADELKAVEYDNGFVRLEDSQGNDLGWVERDKLNRWNDTARFAEGGRLGDLGSEGKYVRADSNEMIANANDTLKFDEMYNYIKNSGGLISQIATQYVNPSNYILRSLPLTDLSAIGSNITNNNDNSTKQGDVQIINHWTLDARNNEKINRIATDANTLMKNDLRKLGIRK